METGTAGEFATAFGALELQRTHRTETWHAGEAQRRRTGTDKRNRIAVRVVVDSSRRMHSSSCPVVGVGRSPREVCRRVSFWEATADASYLSHLRAGCQRRRSQHHPQCTLRGSETWRAESMTDGAEPSFLRNLLP